MRIKNIFSTAAFIVTFVFSSAFANLFIVKSVAVSETATSRSSCRTQQRMLNFLEQDRRYGRELAGDLASADYENNSVNEEAATLKLARKMRRMDDSAMPLEFQTAWENHVRAWEDYADFLYRTNQTRMSESIDEVSDETRLTRNREISRTYYVLLGVARQHGVDFSN